MPGSSGRASKSAAGQCLHLAVAAVCDRRKTALIERRYRAFAEVSIYNIEDYD
jgi:hypothetical protein